uniref:Uncharacterized protein n=1 Tax=Arundo donax TaxID=35708 RepID=A0A0A9AEQ8_ARUDO
MNPIKLRMHISSLFISFCTYSCPGAAPSHSRLRVQLSAAMSACWRPSTPFNLKCTRRSI